MNILVIGGAGFIGSHTVDALLRKGHRIRIYDALCKPVHLKGVPAYLPPEAELVVGDVRDKSALAKALQGMDAVYNFAAYQDYLPDFSTFFSVNAVGTALIYEIIVEQKLSVQKVVVASSQSVAGEGLYRDSAGRVFTPDIRPERRLALGKWDILDSTGRPATSLVTPETVANPQNQYGLSKLSQEKIALSLGRRYGIPTVAMRYSIVQGPRQSFYNAYSGACRIFCLNLFFDRAPTLYEDGQQLRDYVNIDDVVRANLLVLEDPRADYRTFNVGGGRAYTVAAFAEIVRVAFGKDIQPTMPGLYRYGDTRHIHSDIAELRSLGWNPEKTPADSVQAYRDYLHEQTDINDILAYAERKMRDLDVVRKAQS